MDNAYQIKVGVDGLRRPRAELGTRKIGQWNEQNVQRNSTLSGHFAFLVPDSPVRNLFTVLISSLNRYAHNRSNDFIVHLLEKHKSSTGKQGGNGENSVLETAIFSFHP